MADHRLDLAPDVREIARLIDWVESRCDEAGVAGDAVYKLTLALDEAVANVIHHAFADMPPPHRIEVAVVIADDRLTAEVIDNGPAFDPLTTPEPEQTVAIEDRAPGGFGVHLIRRMMDRVEYRREAGENRLLLEKKLR